MIEPTSYHLRIFLHLLAATVWVGGQLTLTGLLPALRAAGGDVPRSVARQFNRIAWPAFGVLAATGVWNLAEVDFGDRNTEYQATLVVKLLLVAVSGFSAAVHSTTKDRRVLAISGAAAGLSSLAVLFTGVLLHG